MRPEPTRFRLIVEIMAKLAADNFLEAETARKEFPNRISAL